MRHIHEVVQGLVEEETTIPEAPLDVVEVHPVSVNVSHAH